MTAPTPAPAAGAVAAAVFGFHGQLVPGLRFHGSQIDALVVPDTTEVARRARLGTPPLLDRTLLEALAVLPHGQQVPWDDLDPLHAVVLDCAPPGVVWRGVHVVQRDWRPALTLAGVVAVDRDWRAGIERAATFRGDAPAAALLARRPHDLEAAHARADLFGVGLAWPGLALGGWERVLPAWPFRPAHDATHWRLLETAYSRWLARQHLRPSTRGSQLRGGPARGISS